MVNYIVVQCGECNVFQCIQAPKSKKFVCRVCNERNSVRRVYGSSNKAREIRPICQSLNIKRGQIQDMREEDAYGNCTVNNSKTSVVHENETRGLLPEVCDWSKFQRERRSNFSTYEENEGDEYERTIIPDVIPRKREAKSRRLNYSKKKNKNDDIISDLDLAQKKQKTEQIEKQSECPDAIENDDEIFQLLFQNKKSDNNSKHDMQLMNKSENKRFIDRVMTDPSQVDEESFAFKL